MGQKAPRLEPGDEWPRPLAGRSAHDLRQEFPSLRKLPSLWTRSFLLSTAGTVSQELIQRYIERQNKVKMDTRTVRKTFKYKLKLTLEQEQAMAFVLRRCHELTNAGLQERREAWQKCGVNITAASQSAQLPDIK